MSASRSLTSMKHSSWYVAIALTLFGAALGTVAAQASIISNVQATKHNLSAAVDNAGVAPPRVVKAVSETQVCVFCHTPHAGNQGVSGPLWNHSMSSATYTTYTSGSMDATATQPTGNSKLCLSCHDGTLAIGTVGVLNNKGNVTIAMAGTALGGSMPNGAGATTGFTRNIGIDLSNDHPISFPYDAALGGTAGADGELRSPPVVAGALTVVGNRSNASQKPTFPLQNNEVQCTTCHDPHLKDTDPAHSALKFLRGNRTQTAQPLGALFVPATDIMCLACHDKAGAAWSNSAHANELVSDETYSSAAADARELARGTAVWQASCLNCHDTHSVEGSRRLLREGTSALDTPKSGGSSAIEQTCYQCHSITGQSILDPIAPPSKAPDIKSDFALNYRMPITNQPESHNIGGKFDDSMRGGVRCNTAGDQCGKDFLESQAQLGKFSAGGNLMNRHAECTDCHNPHRVTKNRLFSDIAVTPDAAGTHKHNIAVGDTVTHNNLASGVLRGTFGVEPEYLSAEFGSNPINFLPKRGDPGSSISTAVTNTYVTREYQVCLKCHSSYGFDETSPPALPLGPLTGGTTSGTNGVVYYGNTAMEFQAPINHQGETSTVDSGADAAYGANNHRSWHPVMDKTGRTSTVRFAAENLWRAPWNGSNVDGGLPVVLGAVGNQTMHCSDCHGSGTNMVDGVNPMGGEDGASWGPHGSNESFILKGTWSTDAPNTHVIGSNNLCFRCHEESQYADAGGASGVPATTLQSGFSGSIVLGGAIIPNLHQSHAYLTTQGGTAAAPNWPAAANGTYRCTMCHVGTAHGWKNKAFLANLNDLGPEIVALGGETGPGSIPLSAGNAVPKGTKAPATVSAATGGYSNGPYYRGAMLALAGFKPAGSWLKGDCASSGCHQP